MTKGRGLLAASAAVAVALAAGACGSRDDGGSTADAAAPGVTDDTITLGTSASFSGPVAAYATLTRSMEAYFDCLNEREGGVTMADGKTRKIELIAYDDGFDPARAIANARRLVEQDQVFGLVATLGTDPSVAMSDYLNQQEVPQAFIVTQSTNFGIDETKPWSIGFMPAIATESGVFVGDLEKQGISGEAAVIHASDAGGKSHFAGLQAALDGSPVEVGAVESFQESDPTINPQISTLARSGAEIFFDLAPPKFAAQAIKRLDETGWAPRHYLPSQSNSIEATLKPAGLDRSKGVLSIAWLKDPADPEWADDPDVVEYKRTLSECGDNLNANDLISVQGYAQGEAVQHALEASRPTRESFMDAVRNMHDVQLKMVLPGITVNTSPDDPFPIESLYLMEFDGERWVLDDEPVSLEGRTPRIEDAG